MFFRVFYLSTVIKFGIDLAELHAWLAKLPIVQHSLQWEEGWRKRRPNMREKAGGNSSIVTTTGRPERLFTKLEHFPPN